MASTLNIYEVGTKVKLNDDDLEAKIVTVAIHASNVIQYECAWWSGEARVRDWFAEDDILEVVDSSKKKNKIGFHNG
tara:strand:+ start:92 stop:322 length:231 start_codon:yes stop_codon:yes gene_type:complete